MPAYYNDHDIQVCEWLRQLIRAGLIADGEVDQRSILDVKSDELLEFTQCHFFAGIGGWSYALKIAGWPDDKPVWTGSPPCQPFSTAGLDIGAGDPRHLAPHFLKLVREARPPVLFGEQVASAAVFGKTAKTVRKPTSGAPKWAWLDDVSDRLEAAHYAIGATDIPAASVGAPHIRQRTFFGALDLRVKKSRPHNPNLAGVYENYPNLRLANTHGNREKFVSSNPQKTPGIQEKKCRTKHNTCIPERNRTVHKQRNNHPSNGIHSDVTRTRPHDSKWELADWLLCKDGKWRPVEPGTFPLADGIPDRLELLRGYGNAINPFAAATFIEAFSEAI